jgi:type IV secretion system protein VirB10
MPAPSGPDPRSLSPVPAEEGVGPVVALPRQGLPRAVLVALAVGAAIILFLILDSRRRSVTPDAAPGTVANAPAPAAAPPLYVPVPVQPQQVYPQQAPVQYAQRPIPAPAPRYQAPAPAPVQPQIVYVPQPAPPTLIQAAPQQVSGQPALVVDTTGGAAPEAAAGAPAGEAAAGGQPAAIAGTRSRAGVLANRSTTVAQGTLIPAVMETAFNSTRPGLARAMVSRDVRGFDGSRVLIPRGSRLIGEYRSEAAPGQSRALVNWLRLIRPDGVTIAIGSPATDPLGRGGIRANVNSHFFERFASALLRSTIDVGLTLAAGAANAPVVLLPGGLGGSLTQTQPREVTRTLTVRQGTSISVFVARDLDFTSAERRR